MTTLAPPPAATHGSLLLAPDDCGWPLSERARAAVAARIDEVLAELAGPLAGPAGRIVSAPGKLLRPALTLGCAALGGAVTPRAISAAAAVELLHCATLVHDDLMDDADQRRGVPTVHVVEGAGTAVVTGDLLIAAALTTAGEAGPLAATELARTLAQLCVGQQAEDRLRFDPQATPEDALDVARGKTGSLLRAACVAGAVAAGLPEHVRSALAEYGMAFGLVLQVLDDVVDLASTAELAGKPVCADFAAGTMTLPITHALRRRPLLAEALRPGVDAGTLAAARELILGSGGIPAAVGLAAEQVRVAERAVAALAAEPGLRARSLASLAALPRQYLQALPGRVAPDLRSLVHTEPDGEVA